MGFLAKLFGAVPREERGGLRLEHPAWQVSHVRDVSSFLRALPELLPAGCILYLEGTTAPDVIAFLDRHAAVDPCKLAMGTIWPRPRICHVPASVQNLLALAELADRHASPEVCDHLHVYKEGRVLLEWYDAFFDPFLLSSDFAEGQIAEFCRRLGCSHAAARV